MNITMIAIAVFLIVVWLLNARRAESWRAKYWGAQEQFAKYKVAVESADPREYRRGEPVWEQMLAAAYTNRYYFEYGRPTNSNEKCVTRYGGTAWLMEIESFIAGFVTSLNLLADKETFACNMEWNDEQALWMVVAQHRYPISRKSSHVYTRAFLCEDRSIALAAKQHFFATQNVFVRPTVEEVGFTLSEIDKINAVYAHHFNNAIHASVPSPQAELQQLRNGYYTQQDNQPARWPYYSQSGRL